MAKESEVKRGELYTNGNDEVAYVHDTWLAGARGLRVEFRLVFYSGPYMTGYADDFLKRFPHKVDRIEVVRE